MDRINFLDDLRADFVRLTTEGNVRSKAVRRSRVTVLVAAAALACAAIVATALVVGSDGGKATPTNQFARFGPAPVPVGSDPFAIGGREVTLAQAQSLAGFTVPTPNAALASPGNLTKVWFASWQNDDRSTAREVVLDYVSSNIRITVAPAGPGFGTDPHAAYLEEAASLGQPASSVQTVNGWPALVVDAANGQNGFVDMDANGTHIAIIGPYSGDKLLTIAGALTALGVNR